jgi:hypothetical protein
MKKIIYIVVFIYTILSVFSQANTNQNGLQSTVTAELSADALQAKRFELASVLFNSHHWQNSSIIQVELFNTRYSSGYEKYIIELGSGQGTGGSLPKIILVESRGIARNARVVLGAPIIHSTSSGGYANKTISIYADVRDYSSYRAKITHLRDKVTSFSDRNQIIISENPVGVAIEDFKAPRIEDNIQENTNQNGLRSTVTNELSADALQAKRFELATVLFNSHHWQNSSIIQVELFNTRYSSGYEKYIIELGYGQGTGSSSPKVTLIESRGIARNARVILGTPIIHDTSAGSKPNKTISIYADIRYYSSYKAKITHLRDKVTSFSHCNQIIINENPEGTAIEDFETPVVDNGIWTKNKDNINYSKGNVGIGTITTGIHKLAVEGSIGAREIKVQATGWADFVFKKEYDLPTLTEVEKHIKKKGHLQNIPSAAEVKKDGFFLGEMDAKLLQKIEELTLYTIQQEKDNKKLLSIIEKLEARIAKIENRNK